MPISKKDFEAAAHALRYAREDAAHSDYKDVRDWYRDKWEFVPENHEDYMNLAQAYAEAKEKEMLDFVIKRLCQAFRQANPRFDCGTFRQWVMSSCMHCGGVVKKEGEQFCTACRSLPKSELEK